YHLKFLCPNGKNTPVAYLDDTYCCLVIELTHGQTFVLVSQKIALSQFFGIDRTDWLRFCRSIDYLYILARKGFYIQLCLRLIDRGTSCKNILQVGQMRFGSYYSLCYTFDEIRRSDQAGDFMPLQLPDNLVHVHSQRPARLKISND